jgi:hypothetical protein
MSSSVGYTVGQKYKIGHECEESAIDRKKGVALKDRSHCFHHMRALYFSPICRGEGIHVGL